MATPSEAKSWHVSELLQQTEQCDHACSEHCASDLAAMLTEKVFLAKLQLHMERAML